VTERQAGSRQARRQQQADPHPRLWFTGFGVCVLLFFVYAVVPASALPGFLPGHAAHSHAHLVGDAMVVAVIGIAMLAGGCASIERLRARRRAREPIRVEVAGEDWKPRLYR
jgi:hypothetical protein